MARIESFEDIQSWQLAKDFTLETYILTDGWRDYSQKDQIRRAAVSIMNNIAEGFERQSSKDFRRLFIAKGSCAEVRSMLALASKLSYLDNDRHKKLNNTSISISRLISGLIKTL